MYPDKHLEDLKSSRKRERLARRAGTSVAFLASFLLLGQAVHELVHVLALEIVGCGYRLDAGFTFLNGLHASVQPLCSPGTGFLSVFYSTGYLSTLVTGWGLLLAAKKGDGSRRELLAASGTGMLMSILLTAGSEGDIESFVNLVGLEPSLAMPVALVLWLVVLAVSFSGVKMLVED